MKDTEGTTSESIRTAAERTTEWLLRSLSGESREAVAQSVAALVDLLCDDAPFDDPEPVATGRIARLAARTLARELVRCW
ncbi:MAG TPA: hypothetical protein VF167_15925, partial [Longimicrobiaceae bacterium]